MDPIIVNGLCVTRGNQRILQDISLNVKEGSFTVLSGPSGCGKSTVLKALQGILQKEDDVIVEGEILIGGKLVQSSAEEVLALSGFLMQNADAQIVNQTAEDELVFNLENHGADRQSMKVAVEKYSKIFNIDPYAAVSKLSGGQKQRLLIASCLCTGHDILLLDEPLANLDKESVEQLLAILKDCCLNGTTILCVEHRLEAVSKIADTLFWMEDGVLSKYCGMDEISAFAAEKAKVFDNALVWNSDIGKSVLHVSGLNARRGKHVVLTDFDIELCSNSTTLLLGRNGCGKTTLMRVLCGLSSYREFNCRSFIYNSKDYSSLPNYRKARKRMGLVFQNPCHQLFMRTVREELLVRNPDKNIVIKIIEMFGIGKLCDRHPYSLSQGEKRLVSVAATAAAMPKLILMDEPTIGQDYQNLYRMAQTLHHLQEEYQTAFLISTHDQLAVNAFGGCIIELDRQQPAVAVKSSEEIKILS